MILNAYQAHATLSEAAQRMLGGGDRTKGVTLLMYGAIVPCTTSPLLRDFALMFGRSRTDYMERCEFLAKDVPVNPAAQPPAQYVMDKGVLVQLVMGAGGPAYQMQLWAGGLLPGGLLYRFELVSASYKG